MPLIFIVDDQMYIRRVLQISLEEKGFKTREFESGVELIKFISEPGETEKPDLILLDIMMPELDGFETLQKLKEFASYSKIPVIIISARNQKEDVLKALKLGAKDFIVKPFDMVSVINKITNIING